ncbi:transcription repressor OFP8-like [Ipomoea triloba]|uniref:transcription repressor OFP8-like n=1 Tax=Ipomoea triloba TaxID=35885 RepID=UPI00125D92E6|nr:transcription repressor OFP8-like [Ipomoea triloba]
MENRFKLKLSRFFRSCKAKNLSTDVVNLHDTTKTVFHDDDNPPMNPHHKRDYQLFELFSPKPRTFPSICRPRFPQSFDDAAAAVSPTLPPYADFYYCGRPRRPRKRRKNKKKKTPAPATTAARSHIRRLDYDDFPAFEYKGLFSSDDEEEEENSTLFSSRSLSVSSSDSAASLRRRRKDEAAAVKDSFAVVKRSSDPYGDFRASMLEMILEKQMFGAKDLEKLLECFLSLNSDHHHGVIIHVFTEICEALFSTCKA